MTPLHQHQSEAPLPRILLLEDDPSLSQAIAATLERGNDQLTASIPEDFYRDPSPRPTKPIAARVTLAHTIPEALAQLDAHPIESLPWDILITDLRLGTASGLDIIKEIRGRGLPLGLILITGHAGPDDYLAAIRCSVDDMLLKPLSIAVLRESVTRCFSRLEESRSQIAQLRRFAEDLIEMRARLADTSQHSTRTQTAVVEALLEALEVREPGAYSHSLRIQAFAVYFAHAINYPESLLPQFERAVILHDIGKIGLTDSLLFKPETMSPLELERMQSHTLLGEQVLSRIPFLRPSALIVRHHHEHYNGSGYPDGISGEAIPLGARIFAIVDALDSMTTHRTYRPALSVPQAITEILRCAGTQFDPRLCELFARIPATTWPDLRLKVEQRRLTRTPTPQGQIPQLTTR